jgi:hypothetical protein
MIKSRCIRWVGHLAQIGETTSACRVLVGTYEGKKPLRRPRHKWEDNIKMYLKEIR